MENNINKYFGQCLCGAVAYEVSAIGPAMAHCHCSMCRKFHGSAFATFGEAKAEDFRWIRGKDTLKEFVADNGTLRRFCSDCGSSMTFAPKNDDGTVIQFALGTLESDPGFRPDAHIFTDYKACWFDIEDKLPRFAEGRHSQK